MAKYGFGKKLNKDYDLILKTWPYERFLHKKLALIIREFNGKTLIEFGCGSGESTIFIHKYNPKLEILAIDNDASVIRNAKNNIKSSNVIFKEIDAFNFKTKKEYDIVSSSHVIHNFSRKRQQNIIEIMYSALRRGGLFIIKDKILPDEKNYREKLWKRQLERFKIYEKFRRPDLKKTMLAHEAKDKRDNVILIETPFKKMLEKTGFQDIKIICRKDRDIILTAKK